MKSFNVFFIENDKNERKEAYNFKLNFSCKNMVTHLIITDKQKWYYLSVKKLFALLRGIISNNNCDYYCIKCFHSFRTKNKVNTKSC